MKKTFTLFCALLGMSAMAQAQTTASWFATDAATEADALSTTYAAGEQIGTTDLFTVTADVALMYNVGKTEDSSFPSIQKSGNAYSFVDVAGTTHNPNQGISMVNNFATADYDNATELSDIYSITAKDKDIIVYVYTVYANKSFNSNKVGTVYCTLNNIKGDVEEWDNDTMKRKNTWTYGQAGINVGAGQTLYIGATGTDGMLWLFGVEAVEGTSEDGGIVGGVEVEGGSLSDDGSSSEGGEDGGDAISSIQADGAVEVARYNLLGQEISEPQKGINIVKYSNGATEKVLVK